MFKIFSALSGISGLVGGAFAYQKTNVKTTLNVLPSVNQTNSSLERFEIEFLDDDKEMRVTLNTKAEYSDAMIKKYELHNSYSQKRNEFYDNYNKWEYFDDETKEKQRIIQEKIQAARRDWFIRLDQKEKLEKNKEIKV